METFSAGFIGAGKVGTSFGKLLAEYKVCVKGYFSRTNKSALTAADFTASDVYESVEALVNASEIIFIAVPDGEIESIIKEISENFANLENKLFVHFSGAKTSGCFDCLREKNAKGISLHPFMAVSDKFEAYKTMKKAIFSVEGDFDETEKKVSLCGALVKVIKDGGATVVKIDSANKTRYHAAAVFASNFYVGLVNKAEEMLVQTGFTLEEAHRAISSLIGGNTENIIVKGTKDALTGPIERGDLTTVINHLKVLTDEEKSLYLSLTSETLKVARVKNPDRDCVYDQLEQVINSEKGL